VNQNEENPLALQGGGVLDHRYFALFRNEARSMQLVFIIDAKFGGIGYCQSKLYIARIRNFTFFCDKIPQNVFLSHSETEVNNANAET